MSLWTIEYNGIEKPLADWGITDAVRVRKSQAIGTLTLTAGGRPIDAVELFAYGAVVIVKRDGVRWFYGRADWVDRRGSLNGEDQFGRLVDPWWYLTQLIFKQVYKVFLHYPNNDPTQPPVFQEWDNPHVMLNQAFDYVAHPDGKLTTGEQIREVLQWAISQGAPIQIGEITPDSDVWIDEDKNLLCDQAIIKQMASTPDAVTDWDMTTLPYPTLNIRRAAELPAVTVPVGGRPTNQLKIKERPDWARPFVSIHFEQSVNGYLSLYDDNWPSPLPAQKFGGFESCASLLPFTSSGQSATLVCEAPAPLSLGWWQVRRQELAGYQAVNLAPTAQRQIQFQAGTLSIISLEQNPDGSVIPLNPALVNELRDGNIADWMVGIGGQRARISVLVNIEHDDGSTQYNMVLYHDCTLTNAVSNTYTSVSITSPGEPLPIGMARQIYEALEGLTAEGMLDQIDAEVASAFDQWCVLNFASAARPAWASLRALPQSITDTIRKGATSVEFGFPGFLNPNQLLALNRAARARLVMTDAAVRYGIPALPSGGAAGVSLGRKSDARSSQRSGGLGAKLVAMDPAGTIAVPGNVIAIDGLLGQLTMQKGPTDGSVSVKIDDCKLVVSGTNQGQALALRKVHFTDTDGDARRCLALVSTPIVDPDSAPSTDTTGLWIGGGAGSKDELYQITELFNEDYVGATKWDPTANSGNGGLMVEAEQVYVAKKITGRMPASETIQSGSVAATAITVNYDYASQNANGNHYSENCRLASVTGGNPPSEYHVMHPRYVAFNQGAPANYGSLISVELTDGAGVKDPDGNEIMLQETNDRGWVYQNGQVGP